MASATTSAPVTDLEVTGTDTGALDGTDAVSDSGAGEAPRVVAGASDVIAFANDELVAADVVSGTLNCASVAWIWEMRARASVIVTNVVTSSFVFAVFLGLGP